MRLGKRHQIDPRYPDDLYRVIPASRARIIARRVFRLVGLLIVVAVIAALILGFTSGLIPELWNDLVIALTTEVIPGAITVIGGIAVAFVIGAIFFAIITDS